MPAAERISHARSASKKSGINMLEPDLVLAIAAGAFVLGLVVGFSIRAYVAARRHRRARARRE